jgi:hypothetical protein
MFDFQYTLTAFASFHDQSVIQNCSVPEPFEQLMLKFINILFQDCSITGINRKPKQGDLKLIGTITLHSLCPVY